MRTLSSLSLMISSVRSCLVPTDKRFTSSFTPLIFVFVRRSYLGRLPSSCCPFCESPGFTQKSGNKGMRKSHSMALRGRMGISRPSSTAPPRTHGRPSAKGEVPFSLRHGPEKDVHRFPGCLIVFATDKTVYSVAFQEDRRIVHPQGYLGPDLCEHLVGVHLVR